MHLKSKLAAGLCAAALMTAGSMAAASTTFDFTGNALDGANSMTVAGIKVTAYAGTYFDNGDFNLFDPSTWDSNQNEDEIDSYDSGDVVDASAGLGVNNYRRDSDAIDGSRVNDLLTLVFDQVVNFEQVAFAYWGQTDSFDLFVNGALVPDEERTGSSPFSLAGLSGTSISFGADARDDSFKVSSITVAAPIPLPAGGVLLLTALGGLGLARRRKG